MIKKPALSGIKRPDITSPSQIREQARILQLGMLRGRAKWWQVVAALIGAVVVASIAAFAIIKVMWATPGLDSSKYQAVFLEDGKVFFGKLRNTDGAYITLESAFYTQSSQSSDGNTTADQTALVEVGSESYGPESNIQIARDKILFWQNLRDNSQVTTAINDRADN